MFRFFKRKKQAPPEPAAPQIQQATEADMRQLERVIMERLHEFEMIPPEFRARAFVLVSLPPKYRDLANYLMERPGNRPN